MMWFALLFLAVYAVPGIRSDEQWDNIDFGGGSYSSSVASGRSGSAAVARSGNSFSSSAAGAGSGDSFSSSAAGAGSGDSYNSRDTDEESGDSYSSNEAGEGSSKINQAFAGSGQSGGAQSYARSETFRIPYREPGPPRSPPKVMSTSAPKVASTPKGRGTTSNDNNPVIAAINTITECAKGGINRSNSSSASGGKSGDSHSSSAAGARSGSSNGNQASASSGQTGGSQSYARAGSSRIRYRRPRPPPKGKPTSAPATTPDGSGTTLNDHNPARAAVNAISQCAINSMSAMTKGELNGIREMLQSLKKKPPNKAVLKIFKTFLGNFSDKEMKSLMAELKTATKEMQDKTKALKESQKN